VPARGTPGRRPAEGHLGSIDGFDALAEFAVALAGFTGVVIVFRRSDDELHPADGIRVFMALVPTLVCAFLAILPLGLELAGVSAGSMWVLAGIAHAVALGLLLAVIGVRLARLSEAARAVLSGPLTTFFFLLLSASVVVNLLSATAVVSVPPAASYFFALMAMLASGATVFARIVFIRPAG
jgi:hypothetical protein